MTSGQRLFRDEEKANYLPVRSRLKVIWRMLTTRRILIGEDPDGAPRDQKEREMSYCDCDDLDCDREHKPSPALRAAIDLKLKVQKLSRLEGFDGLGGHIQSAIETQLWGILHEVMRDGKEVGRLLEREEVVKWMKGSADTFKSDSHYAVAANILLNHADALEAGEHSVTPYQ